MSKDTKTTAATGGVEIGVERQIEELDQELEKIAKVLEVE